MTVTDLVVAFAAGVLVGLVLAHAAGRDTWRVQPTEGSQGP